jgi:hypothetical protein
LLALLLQLLLLLLPWTFCWHVRRENLVMAPMGKRNIQAPAAKMLPMANLIPSCYALLLL